MKCTAIIETENGRWALDDVQLSLLAKAAYEGLLKYHREVMASKGELSPEWYEFEKLIRFLRNPYRDDV